MARRRLAVRRVVTLLNFTQLIARLRPRLIWKIPQTDKAVAKENDRLHEWGCIGFDTPVRGRASV